MKETLKTPCCYNCAYLDDNDSIKTLSIVRRFKCTLLKVYRHRYSRCNLHEERIKGTTRRNEVIINLNPKGGIKDE